MKWLTPDAIQAEHEQLREDLEHATRAGGETAAAARSVMSVLFPHMLLEAEFAIPPLALLPSLARGEFHPGMERILRKTDTLQAELPRLLEQHERIVLALRGLLQAATREEHAGYADFARRLIHHAQMEEEVLYPAAILVGEHIRVLAARQAQRAEDTAA
ncbi:MAG: hypothetical protein WAU32_00340 [Thermoanaerobaculia bacterium]